MIVFGQAGRPFTPGTSSRTEEQSTGFRPNNEGAFPFPSPSPARGSGPPRRFRSGVRGKNATQHRIEGVASSSDAFGFLGTTVRIERRLPENQAPRTPETQLGVQ